MNADCSFAGCAVASCVTLRGELSALREEGPLDPDRFHFTAPGLHEMPGDLAQQLTKQVARATDAAGRIIAVYGATCFVDYSAPSRDVGALTPEQGADISRVDVANCVDMLPNADERQRIADGQNVYWLTPGWLSNWRYIFRDWDSGKASDTSRRMTKPSCWMGSGSSSSIRRRKRRKCSPSPTG